MALKLSTGLRNKMLAVVPAVHETMTAATIAAVTGTPDTFTDSGSGFLALGARVGDIIHVDGFTSANNNGLFTLSVVTAGTLSISETTVTDEAVGDTVTISVLAGGSLKDVFRDGILRIYSGSQPADADTDKGAGVLLVEVTIASGAWVAGAPTNGLRLGTAASGAVSKDASVWSGIGLADGVASWFRFYANATDAGGASITLPRIDGAVGTSGAQLNMSSTTIVTSATTTIDTFTVTLSAS